MFLKAERLGGFIFNSKKIKFTDRLLILFNKRFVKGYVRINGKKFFYPDNKSFIAIYSEVFNKKIYNFQNTHPFFF